MPNEAGGIRSDNAKTRENERTGDAGKTWSAKFGFPDEGTISLAEPM